MMNIGSMFNVTGLDGLRKAVRDVVDAHGLTGASRLLDVPIGQIRSVLSMRSVTASTIQRTADALSLEFYVGPRRRAPKSVNGPPHSQKTAAAEPVRDRDLAELLALLADDWEAADERRRGAIEYAMREQLGLIGGAPVRRVVAWLGWRVIEGDGGRTGHRRARPPRTD